MKVQLCQKHAIKSIIFKFIYNADWLRDTTDKILDIKPIIKLHFKS